MQNVWEALPKNRIKKFGFNEVGFDLQKGPLLPLPALKSGNNGETLRKKNRANYFNRLKLQQLLP